MCLTRMPIRPASPDPRVRWIEATCTRAQVPRTTRPGQFAFYHSPVSAYVTGH